MLVMLVVESFKVDISDNKEFVVCVFNVVLQWADPRIRRAGLPMEHPPMGIWRPPSIFADGFTFVSEGEGDASSPVFSRRWPGMLEWWRPTEPTRLDLAVFGGEQRFRSFPFDSARVDFLFCLSSEEQLESAQEISLEFGFRSSDADRLQLRTPYRR